MTMREPGVRCCHPEVAQRAARFQSDPVLLRPLYSPSQNGRLMPGRRRMAVEVTSGGFRHPNKQKAPAFFSRSFSSSGSASVRHDNRPRLSRQHRTMRHGSVSSTKLGQPLRSQFPRRASAAPVGERRHVAVILASRSPISWRKLIALKSTRSLLPLDCDLRPRS
jgi:hypothetical protein